MSRPDRRFCCAHMAYRGVHGRLCASNPDRPTTHEPGCEFLVGGTKRCTQTCAPITEPVQLGLPYSAT